MSTLIKDALKLQPQYLICVLDSLHPAAPAGFALLPSSSGEEPILSALDTVMIVDTDWTASHSHPGISVWTVMSKTYACQTSNDLCPLSVCSFTVSKNTCMLHQIISTVLQ